MCVCEEKGADLNTAGSGWKLFNDGLRLFTNCAASELACGRGKLGMGGQWCTSRQSACPSALYGQIDKARKREAASICGGTGPGQHLDEWTATTLEAFCHSLLRCTETSTRQGTRISNVEAQHEQSRISCMAGPRVGSRGQSASHRGTTKIHPQPQKGIGVHLSTSYAVLNTNPPSLPSRQLALGRCRGVHLQCPVHVCLQCPDDRLRFTICILQVHHNGKKPSSCASTTFPQPYSGPPCSSQKLHFVLQLKLTHLLGKELLEQKIPCNSDDHQRQRHSNVQSQRPPLDTVFAGSKRTISVLMIVDTNVPGRNSNGHVCQDLHRHRLLFSLDRQISHMDRHMLHVDGRLL